MAKIPQETLEQIATASDIVDVIGRYFPLKRAGAVYKALCPFHQEKTPSFTVNPQRQIFKCFGCGAGGSVFKFVELYENVDFPTAAKRLAERAGIRIVEEQLSPEDDRRFRMRKRLLALHHEAADWFHTQLLKSDAAQPARTYLRGRGITGDVAKAWRIGYAPDAWDAFSNWAAEHGYERDEIAQSGLVKLRDDSKPAGEFYDRFRNRVMFPICNDLGEVIGFSGRVLSADAKEAKYINSPETMLFIKGAVLFGLHKSKRALIDKGSAIVCEGQLDLITAFEAGVQNVIAPQGTAFTEKQARVLKRYVAEVVLCFDADAAGQKAAERSLGPLLEQSLAVRVAQMPAGEDPDSLIRTRGADAFVREIEGASDFFDYQIDRASRSPEFATPRGKMQVARKMAEWAGLISDAILRDAVVNRLTSRLEIPPAEFRKMVKPPSGSTGTKPQEQTAAPVLSKGMALLCQLALQHEPARAWLLGQQWQRLLASDPEGDLLAKLLAAQVRTGDPVSINALLSRLTADEQSELAGLLDQRIPDRAETVVRDCWLALQGQQIKRRQQAISARLKASDLSAEQATLLQKEVLDLQEQLTDIARLSRSPSAPQGTGSLKP